MQQHQANYLNYLSFRNKINKNKTFTQFINYYAVSSFILTSITAQIQQRQRLNKINWYITSQQNKHAQFALAW